MNINGKVFTIGADPEIFVHKDGNFVSAHDLVKGTKNKPYLVKDGAVQVDGLALEFNINPAEDFEQFKFNLNSVQSTLKSMIGDLEFMQACTVVFDEEFTKTVPKANLTLGCEPDYNGWTYDENPPPEQATLLRTVGGHIHIGGFPTDNPFKPEHFHACARLARILDFTLGVYSILWDTDDERRRIYGKAGSFRPKKYGMEYRTLSNKWIFDENLVEFVYDGAERALDLAINSQFDPDHFIEDIINESDRGHEYFQDNIFAKQLVA